MQRLDLRTRARGEVREARRGHRGQVRELRPELVLELALLLLHEEGLERGLLRRRHLGSLDEFIEVWRFRGLWGSNALPPTYSHDR